MDMALITAIGTVITTRFLIMIHLTTGGTEITTDIAIMAITGT